MSKRSTSKADGSRASVSVLSRSPPRDARPNVAALFPLLEPARAGANGKPGRPSRKPLASAVSAVTTSFNPYAPQDQVKEQGPSVLAQDPMPPSAKGSRSNVSAEHKAHVVEPQPQTLPRQVAAHEELPYPASVVSSYQSSWRPEFAKAEPGVCFQRGIIGQDMCFTKPTSLGVNYFRMPDYPDRETLVGKGSFT
mmetsp:Transcript_11603/g.16584  ORF Transcript_11603/g.16584 Transcript_11603/m.16584 type:complete len:195 (+) Transcript_11603:71-655(+)